MNFVQIIATLRKFGNYLAGLFPALVVIVDFFGKLVLKLVDNPVMAPWWRKLGNTAFAQSLWKIIERFYWRTYSKDRLDLGEAPPEAAGLLRPVFQICALLCALIPFTQFNLRPVPIEAFSGFTGSAPSWSVFLWLIALPFGWSALLIGAAISNRVAFCIASCSAAYFLTTLVVLLPRDFANALLPAAIILTLGLCERKLQSKSRNSRIMSVVNCLVCGISAAIPLIILTPIRPWLVTIINLPGPVLSIGGGAIAGTFIGLATLLWSRLPERPEAPIFLRGATPKFTTIFWTLIGLLTAFEFAGLARGNLGQSGSLLLSSLALTTTYFWPVWYFIGVGILHKLMGSSKVLASAVEGMAPPVILTPIMLLALVAVNLIAWSDRLALLVSSTPGTVPEALLPVFFNIFMATKPYIWANPLNTMTVHWLSWVFAFDAIVVLILLLQKRLTSAAIMRLVFLNCLAALLSWEYVFQMSSFARGPGHSVIGLFLFATWLLWLMHTVGWSVSSKSSPCWPSEGRLAIYGGIAAIALLDIHARSACKDFKLMNELFLAMFRGVIDFGLPYYFLVWTSKKIENLPVKISTLLGFYCLGAVTSFLFNALEKLASGNWSIQEMLKISQLQCESLRTSGLVDFALNPPIEYFAIRSVLYLGLLSMIFVVARRKASDTIDSGRLVMFALVAFASGIASFSKTLVELPLPAELRAMIAPAWQELLFSCTVFQSYLAYLIPALLLGIAQLGKDPIRRFFLIAPLAMACHFLITWGYDKYELYLRTCGSLSLVISALAGAFIILVAIALEQLRGKIHSDEAIDSAHSRAKLLTPKGVIALVTAAELIVLPLALAQSKIKLEDRQFKVLGHDITIDSSWVEQPSVFPGPASSMTYSRKEHPEGSSGPTSISLLQMGIVASNPAGTKELLKSLMARAIESKQFPNLSIISIEPWNKYCPEALACHFSYELQNNGTTNAVISGITVLVPRKDDWTEFYTIHTLPSEISRAQAELANAVRILGKKLKNPA